MELDILKKVPILFLMTGMFFVIGLIILGSMQTATTVTRTVTNESYTVPALGGNTTLAHYRVTAITSIKNSTDATLSATNYSLSNPTPTSSKIQTLDNTTTCKTGMTCYIIYTYTDYDNAASTTIDKTATAMSEIPNNWLTLIAVVIAAAIIIGFVMRNLLPATNR